MTEQFKFITAFPDAHPIIRADKTALGTIPAKAMQYCEAMRTASSFGWYAFPAASVTLLFDGQDTYIEIDDEWELLKTEHVTDPDSWWNLQAPEDLEDKAPPFITDIGVPGYVQIWSGHMVQTPQDWSVLVRPLANVKVSGQISCFEGIVEADDFRTCPLFTNVRILKTDTPITIHANEPLFQVQPIHRSCYSSTIVKDFSVVGLGDMDGKDWQAYSKTVRSIEPEQATDQTGRYAAHVRKRARQPEK